MSEVERYHEDGQSRADVTVVISRDGAPVAGALVTLNGRAVAAATSGGWYRALGLPFDDAPVVTIDVVSSIGNRSQSGWLPGEIAMQQPQAGAAIPDGAPILVAWEAVDWDSTATPRAITLEFSQGSPFHFVTLPPEATSREVPASVTQPSAMEFLVVEAWAGPDDPGNLQRGDWLGKDGLRLGSRAVRSVEITE